MENYRFSKLRHRLTEARGDLLLLVHPAIPILDQSRSQIQALAGAQEINLGQALSKALVEIPLDDRPRSVQEWFYETFKAAPNGPVLLTQIDLLFDPTFHLDPLALFRQVSRRKPLLVLWPGDYAGETLSYAAPEHSHYRTWHAPAAGFICRLED